MSWSSSMSGSEFQTDGSATENARRPNILSRYRDLTRSWRLADLRCRYDAVYETGMQCSDRYWGTWRWTQSNIMMPSSNTVLSGTLNQYSSSRRGPRQTMIKYYLLVPVTTRQQQGRSCPTEALSTYCSTCHCYFDFLLIFETPFDFVLNSSTPTVAMWVNAIKHPVPDWVKPSFVFFDI